MLLAFETVLDCCELTVIAYPFLLEPFDYLFIGLLDGLSLIILDHDLIEPILQNPDVPHEWALLDLSQLVVFDLLELVLERKESALFDLGVMSLVIEQPSEVILIAVGNIDLSRGPKGAVV